MARANTALQAREGEFLSIDRAIAYAPTIAASVPHHKMSERYAQTNTMQTINAFHEAGFGMKSVQTVQARDTGRVGFEKHLIRFAPVDVPAFKDRLEILDINSHDGTSAELLSLGAFRFVCANGIIAGTQFETERVRHVGAARDLIREAIERIRARFGQLAGVIDDWKTITLGKDEYQEFAQRVVNLAVPPQENEDGSFRKFEGPVTQILQPRRVEDNARDLWTVFNVAQERVMSGRFKTLSQNQNGQRRLARARGITSINSTFDTNRKLWDIAASFAA